MVLLDEKSRLRQFWLRVLLTVGMLWGTMPLITVGFAVISANRLSFGLVALIFNAATVLPASALAFWHRRTACIWLSFNGALAAIALVSYARRTSELNPWQAGGLAGSLVIALCLDWMEMRRWPSALEQ
jgi:hypothetical protein